MLSQSGYSPLGETERENRSERAIRRMGKARAKLRPEPHIKPKRMRHKTYIQVASEYLVACREAAEAQYEWNLRFLEQMQQEEEHFGS